MLCRRQFYRYLSSVSGKIPQAQKAYRPIEDLLADIQTHFSGTEHVKWNVNAVQGIIPALGTLRSKKFDPTTITIGLMQSEKLPGGLLMECLARDPFGMDSNRWIDGVQKYRGVQAGKPVRLIYEDDESKSGIHKDCDGVEEFRVKSPFLDRSLRLEQRNKAGVSVSRMLFNDLNIMDSVDVSLLSKCQVLIGLNLGDVQKEEVKRSIGSESCIFVNSPISKDGPHGELCVDVEKLQAANAAIGKSVDNVSEYVELFEKSNAKALFTKINEVTAGYRPLVNRLKLLERAISGAVSSSAFLTDVEIDDIRKEISNWARESHLELQECVSPYLEEVFVKEFTKVSRILWNGDHLHTVMAESLAKDDVIPRKYADLSHTKDPGFSIGYHGSLRDSESQLSGLRRKIYAVSPVLVAGEADMASSGSSSMNPGEDPMQKLQKEVSGSRLPELQSSLNRIIVKQNLEITLPVFCVSMVGYVTNFCDLNTGIAVFAFSVAIVALRTSSKVYKEVEKFADWYYERVRRAVDSTVVYMNDMLSRNFENYQQEQKVRADLDAEMREKIEVVEKTEKMLEESTQKQH